MLNTQKLLYILPDVAYVAELLPGKKPHSFSVQSFRQINGEYLNDDEFIAENVIKLLSKLEDEEYHLVLPDHLFTNTMVTVKETDDKKIETYINENLLPELNINRTSHQVIINKLTTLKGESRVQFSALEQSLLAPLRVGSGNTKNKITALSPLSWTLKSVVSLEPSVTILQMGTSLFSALHYIGVDQAFQAPVDDIEAIAETVKTLKGSEPNIQTVYLVTNTVVEERLKELLSDTIPLQQLNIDKEDDSKIPSYVKYCIEAGQKTISISDYPVPNFSLGKSTAEDNSLAAVKPLALEPADEVPTLPEPNTPLVSATVENQKDTLTMPDTSITSSSDVPSEETTKVDIKETKTEITEVNDTSNATDKSSVTVSDTTTMNTGDVDLSQFAVQAVGDGGKTVAKEETPVVSTSTKPIKNQSGVGSMIKMIVITLVVFIVTVAVGVGIGFGLLTLSKSKTPVTPTPAEVVEVEPTATPQPTPIASASAKVAPADASILIVNATTKAGYASTIKDMVVKAKFGSVTAGNAKGEYASASSNLVLMAEKDQVLLTQLEKATSLGLAFSEGYSTEDAKGTYDAVIVLTK